MYAHGALNAAAVALTRIANDLRLMASGPRAGLAEITLPAIQPGSSIMPGKVNPVVPEAVTMVAAQVMGNHTTVTVAGMGSLLELNVMMPVTAHALLESIALLSAASIVLAEKCVDGITANEERCRELLEGNLSLATALAPRIGYDLAAQIAKDAFKEGKTAREMARVKANLPEDELNELPCPEDDRARDTGWRDDARWWVSDEGRATSSEEPRETSWPLTRSLLLSAITRVSAGLLRTQARYPR